MGGSLVGCVVRLRVPTDFDILEVLARGKRQTPANIAALVDKGRQYVTKRTKYLAEHGLVHEVGPARRSGMYVVTARGEAALARRDEYDHHRHERFERRLEEYPAEVTDAGELVLDDAEGPSRAG